MLFYLISSNLNHILLANVSLILLLPFLLLTAIDISRTNTKYKVHEPNIRDERILVKSCSKLYCQPDDLAYALCKETHRKKWDLNLLSFEEGESKMSGKLDHSLQLTYQSQKQCEIIKAVDYTFYKEEQGLYYILEASLIDVFENEHNYRLFELSSSIDKDNKECFIMTVYSDITRNMAKYQGYNIIRSDYVKGLLMYIDMADDLPSYNSNLITTNISSVSSESENIGGKKMAGKFRSGLLNSGKSLEQINESAEDNYTEDDIEEYKIEQFNMKDTLLTIDKSDLAESSNINVSVLYKSGEINADSVQSDDYEIDMQDKLYDEVDMLLESGAAMGEMKKTDSIDLSMIKNEAREYDSRRESEEVKQLYDLSGYKMISSKHKDSDYNDYQTGGKDSKNDEFSNSRTYSNKFDYSEKPDFQNMDSIDDSSNEIRINNEKNDEIRSNGVVNDQIKESSSTF